MQATVRPYVVGGVALAGASLIAVTPVVAPPDPHTVSAAVRLVDASDLLADLGGGSGLLGDGSILNIPYNIFADIVNIPYEESLALQEYAYALGPAGSVGGVADWIPPGATVADGGVDVINGQDFYALGGTGSWYMESIGNTWGWDDGNWPQVDGLIHFLLPFQWTEGITTSLQSVAQSALLAGSADNCEFECSNVLAYLGGWLTNFGNVFSSTYPVTQTDTVGSNVGDVVNVGPDGSETTAIWSGQPTINPLLEPFQAIWQNATASPGSDPIQLPNIVDVFDNVIKLNGDFSQDFDTFITGSYLYWGAPTLYTIPSLIAGVVHSLSLGLIPNEFVLANNGGEPVSGYTAGPGSVPGGLAQGLQFLLHGADGDHGLLGYLDPSTWGASGADASAAASAADTSPLLSDLSSLLPNLGTDLSSLTPNLGTDLASMLPQLSADLSSWFPDLATSLIP
jgi:hypothetical protein